MAISALILLSPESSSILLCPSPEAAIDRNPSLQSRLFTAFVISRMLSKRYISTSTSVKRAHTMVRKRKATAALALGSVRDRAERGAMINGSKSKRTAMEDAQEQERYTLLHNLTMPRMGNTYHRTNGSALFSWA